MRSRHRLEPWQVPPGERCRMYVVDVLVVNFILVVAFLACLQAQAEPLPEPPTAPAPVDMEQELVDVATAGLLVGLKKNKVGQLCGELKGTYRYYDSEGKRGSASKLTWVSSAFFTRKDGASSAS